MSILVHGGAGPIAPDDDAAQIQAGCLAAARIGAAILARGGSALDAVVEAVVALEDDPLFNAGTGGALNSNGDVETDASLMTGVDRSCGAVAALEDVKNPVRLARLVMERTPHVLLVGAGARAFAAEQGLALLPKGALVTDRARRKLASHGTVGAVARDRHGHVAAATSTGGTTGKRPGRVGDSPLIGAGTFADDALGACSCTGLGEAIIRAGLARHACDLLARGDPADVVARRAITELARFRGDGGLILVDAQGRLGVAFDTQRMARAWVEDDGREGAGFTR